MSDVAAGNSLIMRHHDEQGLLVGEAAFALGVVLNHKTGLIVEAELVAGSARVRASNARKALTLHLCNGYWKGALQDSENKASERRVLHLEEWCACKVDDIPSPWISAAHLKSLRAACQRLKTAAAEGAEDYSDEANSEKEADVGADGDEGRPIVIKSRPKKSESGKSEKAAVRIPGRQSSKTASSKRSVKGDAEAREIEVASDEANSAVVEDGSYDADEDLPVVPKNRSKKAAKGSKASAAKRSILDEDEDKRGKFTRLRDKMADLFGKNPAGANKSSNEVKESPRDVKKIGVEDLRKLLQKKKAEVAAKEKKTLENRGRDRKRRNLLAMLVAKKRKDAGSDSGSMSGKDTDSGDDDADHNLPPRPRREKQKRHKMRKKEKTKRRASSSDSAASSSVESGEGLSVDAGRGATGLASRLERVAARRPGRLLARTLEAMQKCLAPGSGPLGDQRPPVMFRYLQQALGSRHRLEGRNERELVTLATAVDYILKGDLERGLDVLSQCFKRVEAQAAGLMSKEVAERLEIIPRTEVTCVSLAGREEATEPDQKWAKQQGRPARREKSPFRA